ncbi:MAG TPA: M56 family metallopeptidase [Terriglobales bacterium]|jgi:Zn-dependent protease with chaperone function
MILPYYLRLLCLSFATFFVAHALSWLIVRRLAPTALKIAETVSPRWSSRLLFGLRMAPAAIALFLVVGFCVPSYVWLEPHIASERVGFACILAALLGAAISAVAWVRGFLAVGRTARYVRLCQSTGVEATVGRNIARVLVLNDDVPLMAVAGVIRPRLVVSRSVMNALSDEQKEAAFRHEAAHRISRDNLKKFFFLLAPDVVPFVSGLSNLENGWTKFTEWAADDQAVDGDPQRALSLASALVKVAKMGVHPTPSYLLSSLVDDDRDLETRVDRLLREPAYAEKPLAPMVAFARNASLVIAGVAATILLWPESLGGIHRLLEHLVQ